MCRVLDVSRSGYYAWRKRPVSAREMANQQLVAEMRVIHAETYETYGSPRMCDELNDKGIPCSENRVARLMRKHGIRGKQVRRRKVTTKANPEAAKAPNLLQQQFAAAEPNTVWCSDISYIWTREGWLYLAVVLDLFSRRIVGWSLAARMTTQLVVDAFTMAVDQRRPPPGLIHHSDQGSQYTSHAYQALLQKHKCRVSMSGRGNCYDNAVVESFFGTLKMERVFDTHYQTREAAKTDIFFYIEAFYNRRRRHSANGSLSPVAYEAQAAAKIKQTDHSLCLLN